MAKKTSANKKRKYEHYKNINQEKTNRIKKMKRHIKKLPGDLQAQKNLQLIMN